jgi:hypothetical protein
MLLPTIRSHLLVLLFSALVAGFAWTAQADAGIGAAAIADCNAHAALTQHYTVAELRNALATLPPSVAAYTNCQAVITQALTAAIGEGKNNGTGDSSGGSFLPTPVIVILVLLALAAATFAALAVRRRRSP